MLNADERNVLTEHQAAMEATARQLVADADATLAQAARIAADRWGVTSLVVEVDQSEDFDETTVYAIRADGAQEDLSAFDVELNAFADHAAVAHTAIVARFSADGLAIGTQLEHRRSIAPV